MKKPAQLQEVLDISRTLLSEVEAGNADLEIEEKRGKLEQLKSVLEMYQVLSFSDRSPAISFVNCDGRFA